MSYDVGAASLLDQKHATLIVIACLLQKLGGAATITQEDIDVISSAAILEESDQVNVSMTFKVVYRKLDS